MTTAETTTTKLSYEPMLGGAVRNLWGGIHVGITPPAFSLQLTPPACLWADPMFVCCCSMRCSCHYHPTQVCRGDPPNALLYHHPLIHNTPPPDSQYTTPNSPLHHHTNTPYHELREWMICYRDLLPIHYLSLSLSLCFSLHFSISFLLALFLSHHLRSNNVIDTGDLNSEAPPPRAGRHVANGGRREGFWHPHSADRDAH